jgi:hypothetical protein
VRIFGGEGPLSVGAKTVTTLVLTALALGLAGARGAFARAPLVARGFGTLFVVGLFGAVVGALMFRFFGLGERSRYALSADADAPARDRAEVYLLGLGRWRVTLGEARDDAFELPPALKEALCIAIALLVALGCLDARALDLLARFRQRAAESSSFCPEEELPVAAPAALDPNAPGCELVRRAVALGYASSLGECAGKAAAQKGAAPCTRRRRDEPLLHYTWRLLDGFFARLARGAGAGYVDRARRDFHARAAHLVARGSVEREVLASAPHASHHVFTNLPDPKNGAFAPRTCADRYRWLAHGPTPSAGAARASEVFEHVTAQLLFEGRYEPAAGYCREYHVHWGAPPDACARLGSTPEAFLKERDALGDVRAVLARARVSFELAGPGARAPDAAAFVTFQCYVEGDAPGRRSLAFTLDGQRFAAEEVRVAPSPANATVYVDRYDAIAGLFVEGFHYGQLLSEAGLTDRSPPALAAPLDGRDFLITRLYELDSVDLYLGPAWLADRLDLLEVYPYQRHLRSFVQAFRRQYRQARTRL